MTPPPLEGGGRGEGCDSRGPRCPHPSPPDPLPQGEGRHPKATGVHTPPPNPLPQGEGESAFLHAPPMTLLSVENLSVAYGDMLAVHDVSFSFDTGEVFVLLGANGAGKTSILRCISGLVPARSGSVAFEGRPLKGKRPHEVARTGIAHVPEGRRVFPNLSVEDNLIVSFIRPARRTRSRRALDAVLRILSAPAGAATPTWWHAVRRRAADAGDRQGDDEFSAAADVG